MDHVGLPEPENLRDAAPEQVEDWREALLARGAVEANPVRGVERPADEEGRTTAPVLTGEQARRLLDAPPGGTIKGRLDRALDPGSVYSNVVRYYSDRSGLTREVEGLCAHSLRATAATTALHDGARLEAVRDWLGRTTLGDTTLRATPGPIETDCLSVSGKTR